MHRDMVLTKKNITLMLCIKSLNEVCLKTSIFNSDTMNYTILPKCILYQFRTKVYIKNVLIILITQYYFNYTYLFFFRLNNLNFSEKHNILKSVIYNIIIYYSNISNIVIVRHCRDSREVVVV
ncbi:Uncharacterized protein FWK35_00007029 [Aphis craccivora]|uniref:Uncharacterized protein n=1 Tax=Aphis craccivora TaxID=307492 RepID=A0A6G0YRG5_APHCR|nr:Uncharacterized protein FWK35_00007029 [Aphis craccivora]